MFLYVTLNLKVMFFYNIFWCFGSRYGNPQQCVVTFSFLASKRKSCHIKVFRNGSANFLIFCMQAEVLVCFSNLASIFRFGSPNRVKKRKTSLRGFCILLELVVLYLEKETYWSCKLPHLYNTSSYRKLVIVETP